MGAWIETLKSWVTGYDSKVAPHVGAWIETGSPGFAVTNAKFVAPHVGAWIETDFRGYNYSQYHVAPHVGAWIETIC